MTISPAAALLLFTRFPEPGQAKTRLIPLLGPKTAAAVHRQLSERIAQQLLECARQRRLTVRIFYSGGSHQKMRVWLGDDFQYLPQRDGDIGTRMMCALKETFADGFQRVVLAGSDIPDLDAALLAHALEKTDDDTVVIGPAVDGGYYLIGMSTLTFARFGNRLFNGIAWSTSEVCRQTSVRIEELGLHAFLLPELRDVDCPEDLSFFPELLLS